ncbi:MAG: GNAT family N-acetyltransferase [Verrucomicrobiota bacterium]
MIRAAVMADAPQLAALMTQLGYPTQVKEMRARLRSIFLDNCFRTFVATDDEQIVGMAGTSEHASYEHDDRTGRIVAMVVSNNARRKGVGRQLMGAVEKSFRSRGVRRIVLNARLERVEAHQFYQALGYRKTGWRFAKFLE